MTLFTAQLNMLNLFTAKDLARHIIHVLSIFLVRDTNTNKHIDIKLVSESMLKNSEIVNFTVKRRNSYFKITIEKINK